MKALCLSASNIAHSGQSSTSLRLCQRISDLLQEHRISCDIVDLRSYALQPCIGCGGCYHSRRCIHDEAFNRIYEKIIDADCLCIISPHYAPIPAKLCMMLEKMEEITFLHWWKDSDYRSEVYHLPTAVISHGGGAGWALSSYRAMVNDTIFNALDTIQCKVIPYDDQNPAGLTLPLLTAKDNGGIFPVQTYDWPVIDEQLRSYVARVLEYIKRH